MLFSKKPPIYDTIDEFAEWKSERFPWIAGSQRSLLYRFAQTYKIDNVEEVREDQIAFFVGEELTQFYALQATKAIRGFLWYCDRSGYDVFSYKMVTEEKLKRAVGHPVDWDMVKRTAELREGRGLTFEAIARVLTKETKRKVHKTSTIRWYRRASQLP